VIIDIQNSFIRLALVSTFTLASTAFALRALAADDATGASTTHEHGASGAMTGKTPAKLDAALVEPEKKAKEKAATVKVTVTGVQIVDPATDAEKPVAGHAHLHYQVDADPVIATTASKLSFHDLPSGQHTIKVVLAGSDHAPLGPEKTLSVDVP
jgi:hypothetical protein